MNWIALYGAARASWAISRAGILPSTVLYTGTARYGGLIRGYRLLLSNPLLPDQLHELRLVPCHAARRVIAGV